MGFYGASYPPCGPCVLHCGMTDTALPERGSIEAARLAWTAQRQDNNAGRRDGVHEIIALGGTSPGGEEGDVGPGWETAPETERVRQGRRLRAPRAIADWLIDRRQ